MKESGECKAKTSGPWGNNKPGLVPYNFYFVFIIVHFILSVSFVQRQCQPFRFVYVLKRNLRNVSAAPVCFLGYMCGAICLLL